MPSWRDVGFYDEYVMYQDYDMRLKHLKRLQVAYVPQILSSYRVINTSLSKGKAKSHLIELKQIYTSNAPLLADYDAQTIAELRHDYDTYLAKIARDGAWKALKEQPIRRGEALALWWQSVRYEPKRITPLLVIKALLPQRIYAGLKSLKGSLLA